MADNYEQRELADDTAENVAAGRGSVIAMPSEARRIVPVANKDSSRLSNCPTLGQ